MEGINMPIEITGWFSTSDSAEQTRRVLSKWHGVRSAIVDLDTFPVDPVLLGNFSFTDNYQLGNYSGLAGIYPDSGHDGEGTPGVRLKVNVESDVADGVKAYMLEHGAVESGYYGD